MYEQICEICGKTFLTRRKRDNHVCWECREKVKLGEKIFNKIKSGEYVKIEECQKLELSVFTPYGGIKCLLYKLVDEISDDGTISKEAQEKLKTTIWVLYSLVEIAKNEGFLRGLKAIFMLNNGKMAIEDYNIRIEKTEYELKQQYENLNFHLNRLLKKWKDNQEK